MSTGCVTPSYYKEASPDQPHAILQFEEAEGKINNILGVLKVTPIKINNLPPNEWAKFSLRKNFGR